MHTVIDGNSPVANSENSFETSSTDVAVASDKENGPINLPDECQDTTRSPGSTKYSPPKEKAASVVTPIKNSTKESLVPHSRSPLNENQSSKESNLIGNKRENPSVIDFHTVVSASVQNESESIQSSSKMNNANLSNLSTELPSTTCTSDKCTAENNDINTSPGDDAGVEMMDIEHQLVPTDNGQDKEGAQPNPGVDCKVVERKDVDKQSTITDIVIDKTIARPDGVIDSDSIETMDVEKPDEGKDKTIIHPDGVLMAGSDERMDVEKPDESKDKKTILPDADTDKNTDATVAVENELRIEDDGKEKPILPTISVTAAISAAATSVENVDAENQPIIDGTAVVEKEIESPYQISSSSSSSSSNLNSSSSFINVKPQVCFYDEEVLKKAIGDVNKCINSQKIEPAAPLFTSNQRKTVGLEDSYGGITGTLNPSSVMKIMKVLCKSDDAPLLPEYYLFSNESVFCDIGSGTGRPVFYFSCLPLKQAVGFDVCELQVYFSLSNKATIEEQEHIKLKTRSSFFHCNASTLTNLNGITHVYALCGDSSILKSTVFLVARTATVKVLVILALHKNDLIDLGIDIAASDIVRLSDMKLKGGDSHTVFVVPVTEPRRNLMFEKTKHSDSEINIPKMLSDLQQNPNYMSQEMDNFGKSKRKCTYEMNYTNLSRRIEEEAADAIIEITYNVGEKVQAKYKRNIDGEWYGAKITEYDEETNSYSLLFDDDVTEENVPGLCIRKPKRATSTKKKSKDPSSARKSSSAFRALQFPEKFEITDAESGVTFTECEIPTKSLLAMSKQIVESAVRPYGTEQGHTEDFPEYFLELTGMRITNFAEVASQAKSLLSTLVPDEMMKRPPAQYKFRYKTHQLYLHIKGTNRLVFYAPGKVEKISSFMKTVNALAAIKSEIPPSSAEKKEKERKISKPAFYALNSTIKSILKGADIEVEEDLLTHVKNVRKAILQRYQELDKKQQNEDDDSKEAELHAHGRKFLVKPHQTLTKSNISMNCSLKMYQTIMKSVSARIDKENKANQRKQATQVEKVSRSSRQQEATPICIENYTPRKRKEAVEEDDIFTHEQIKSYGLLTEEDILSMPLKHSIPLFKWQRQQVNKSDRFFFLSTEKSAKELSKFFKKAFDFPQLKEYNILELDVCMHKIWEKYDWYKILDLNLIELAKLHGQFQIWVDEVDGFHAIDYFRSYFFKILKTFIKEEKGMKCGHTKEPRWPIYFYEPPATFTPHPSDAPSQTEISAPAQDEAADDSATCSENVNSDTQANFVDDASSSVNITGITYESSVPVAVKENESKEIVVSSSNDQNEEVAASVQNQEPWIEVAGTSTAETIRNESEENASSRVDEKTTSGKRKLSDDEDSVAAAAVVAPATDNIFNKMSNKFHKFFKKRKNGTPQAGDEPTSANNTAQTSSSTSVNSEKAKKPAASNSDEKPAVKKKPVASNADEKPAAKKAVPSTTTATNTPTKTKTKKPAAAVAAADSSPRVSARLQGKRARRSDDSGVEEENASSKRAKS